MKETFEAGCFVVTFLPRNRLNLLRKTQVICTRCSRTPPSCSQNQSDEGSSKFLANSFKKVQSSSFPALPDLPSLQKFFPESGEKAQQVMNKIRELWELSRTPETPVHTLSLISSLNDLLFQALEETLLVPDEAPVPIPTNPSFDPILSLQLAAYAFRAYIDPSEAAYREIVVSYLPKPPEEKIYNHLAFADTSFIASSATGLFMIQLTSDIEDAYLTATVNDGISLDLLKLKHVTILRCIRNHHDNSVQSRDVLTLDIYNSKEDYASSSEPTQSASLDLHKIVDRALQAGEIVHGDAQRLEFSSPSQKSTSLRSFQFQWPSEFGLTLPSFPFAKAEVEESNESKKEKLTVSVQVSFVPFSERNSIQGSNASDTLDTPSSDLPNDSSRLTDVAQKALQAFQTAFLRARKENLREEQNLTGTDRQTRNIIREVLRSKLPEGAMPTPADWNRFITAAISLYDAADENRIIASSSKLSEQMRETLFVESMSTDTQAWLYQDKVRKNLVVSFRGTEQVKWRDFFTDAQTFLQRWVPGEEIDLTIKAGQTVGLDTFVPNILPKTQVTDTVPGDAIAVHYGFLRAYLSVQSVLLRSILSLTSNLEEDYSIYFTGHSLGGALAIVAAADFVARYGWDKVCCMSYGAPKVGNINFARRYNELVPNSFRIVNDEDLVSRMPRSVSEGNPVSRYRHSGRTVLLNEQGDYWIEGTTSSPYPNGKSVFDVLHERCTNLSDLLEMEQRLWDNLLSGKSVQHHLECSYFASMHQVVRRYIKETKS